MSGSLVSAFVQSGVSVLLRTRRGIGTIVPDCVVEESHSDSLAITEHPVEQGAPITDHAYKRPAEVMLRYQFSPSSLRGLLSTAKSAFSALSAGKLPSLNASEAIYKELVALQESRELISITTGKRKYKNMLISELRVQTNSTTENILDVYATAREVNIVKARTTTLPAAENQTMPDVTSEVVDGGVRQAQVVPENSSALASVGSVLGF